MVELDETFFVNLMNPVGAIIVDDQGQGTILNDDAAEVSIDDVSLNEGDSGTTTMTFTVTLDHAVDVPVSVNSSTADDTAVAGSDYTAAAGILNFTGTEDESQIVSVDVFGDTLVERDETFFINLSDIAAGGRNVTFANDQGFATIINDDAATISIDNVTMTEGDSPDITDFIFTVMLDNNVDTAVTVDFATADGTATLSDSDYMASNGTLNFSGIAGEKQTKTVQVIGDDTLEGDEAFFATLSNIQADGRNVNLPENPGLGTINNDDNGVALIGNTLFVIGTDGNDRVSISPKCNGLIKVYANFLSGRCHARFFDAEDIQNIDIQLKAGNDRATISSKIDLPASIYGGAGNDYLRAGIGWTVLDGGDGNDKLIGGRMDDLLLGGDGNDKLIGNDGNDILDGGGGDDRLYGNDGDDLLDGGTGNDLLFAGRGNDLIFSGPGNDKAYGGRGNDLLFGGSGQDRLYGGNDDDLIFAGDGNDFVSGGRGNDELFGGMGDDRLFGDQGNDKIFGDDDNDLIVGGQGNDILDGGHGNDCLYGGCGDDVLTGGQGNDTLDGGFGNDELFAGRGNDKLYGGFGNDMLKGGAGDDKLSGGFGDDVLKGGRGDDLLDGGFGDDQLFGRRGDDKLMGGFGNDLLKGGPGDDKLSGGFGDDLLKGGRGDDKLSGGFGDDILRGGRGDDLLIGGFGHDELFGGPGDDKLIDWSGRNKGFKFCGHHLFHKIKFHHSSSWIKAFVSDPTDNWDKPNPNKKIKLSFRKK
jgi:Ca2+-binding RTX toxin-like protein